MTEETENAATTAATYKNLDEFLEGRGIPDSFWYWGRCLYKGGFGAWVSAEIGCLTEDQMEELQDITDNGEGGPMNPPATDPLPGHIYYEDDLATKKFWHSRCCGIRVGSIIEGADYDCESRYLEFPFTDAEWEREYAILEAECTMHWKWNNSTYYSVWHGKENIGHYQWIDWNDGPEGAKAGKSAEDDVAIRAGQTIFAQDSYQDGDEFPIPETACTVKVEPMPDTF